MSKIYKPIAASVLALLAVVLAIPQNLPAQAVSQETSRDTLRTWRGPLEVPGGPYIPVTREQQPRSSAYQFAKPGFFMIQVNVDDSSRNIVGDAANEPSLAVDPTNPNRMVIGWRQFNTVTSNFRQAGYAYTTNGGRRWRFPGVLEPGIFRSDPVLESDSSGNIYYNSLTNS